MIPKTTKEMEPRIRQRYHFATSSFARMYTPPGVTPKMSEFCYQWALGDEVAPLDCLNHVDRYFRELWNRSS